MQIDTLKSYKSAFKMLSSALIGIIIACLLVVGLFGYLLFDKAQAGYESVWIVDPKSGQAYRADRVESKQNPGRKFEYENHVKMLYKSWFEFDQFTFKEKVDKGLNYLGNCGKTMYNDYKSQDLHRKMAEKNLNFTVEVDSIVLDMFSVPVRGKAYAVQVVESPAGSVRRYMNSTFYLIDLAGRSSENPHGCLIEDFTVLNSEVIKKPQP